MKLLTSPIPSCKELIGMKSNDIGYWQENAIWTSKSAISIRLILEEMSRVTSADTINVLIPNLFCGETEQLIGIDGINIIHYPLTESLDPNWEVIKNDMNEIKVDAFILVHYFGVYHDPNRAKSFCKDKGAVFIEDAAHCLFRYQKIGQAGDFTVFSCHKLLPVPDGAVILVNENSSDQINEIAQDIRNRVKAERNESKNVTWRIKKAVQKVIHINKPYKYERKTHYFSNILVTGKEPIGISSYSKKIIQNYSYEQFKTIAYIRRENCCLLNYFVKSIDPNIIPLIPNDCECPYFAAFLLSQVIDKDSAIDKLLNAGIPVMSWPELPESVRELPPPFSVNNLSKDIIVLPVHQSIYPGQLANHLSSACSLGEDAITVEPVSKSEIERWNRLFDRIHLTNITQHWAYGDVKKCASGWDVERLIIQQNGEDVGVLQMLVKRILGRKTIYRVNKGPIFSANGNNIDLELRTMDMVLKKLKRPFVFFYVPFTKMSAENYIKTIKCGWKNWDIFGFPTGTIDLDRSEEDIRKSLNSKWRNQLKASEKKGYTIKNDDDKFDRMIELYEDEQKDKGFDGVDTRMIKAMHDHPDKPLRFYYVESVEGDLAAFDIFYKHGTTATYYIGWNSEVGRKDYLNNLLLYNAALSLKKESVKVLDLGGIEYIHTEAIAKFKDGMNPSHFRQMGEFIKVK